MEFIKFFIYFFGFLIGGFLYYCFNKHNNYFHGPNSKDFINKIYIYGGNYYIFKPEICICSLFA